MKYKKEIILGLLITVGIALLIWGINFLKGKDIFSNKREIFAVYKQVNGLSSANPILINGLKVGQVREVFFHPNGSGNVVVRMNLTNDFSIPKNSVARIISSDLLGSKAVDIQLGDSKKNIENGDTLLASIQSSLQEEVNIQLLPLKRKAEDMMLSLDSVLAVVQYIFNENTRENLAKSFESLKITISNLEHTTFNLDTLVGKERGRLGTILSNVESITTNFKGNNQKINNLIANFSEISDTLAKANVAKTIRKADNTLKEMQDVMGKINRGEGSMGMLVNNDSLYKKLDNTVAELNLLFKDIKENPNRYVQVSVFGKKNKKDKKKTTNAKNKSSKGK